MIEYTITEKELDELIELLEWAEYAATDIDLRANARNLVKTFKTKPKRNKPGCWECKKWFDKDLPCHRCLREPYTPYK